MAKNHILMDRYRTLTTDRTLTTEDYQKEQKEVLREAMAALKQNIHPDLDFIIGSIALYDGDKYGIELKNAMNHLMRACKNGNINAGLALSLALRGQIQHVPEEMRNRDKSLEILLAMEPTGSPAVLNDLSCYYLDLIHYTVEGGGYAPEEWFHQAYKYASDTAEKNYIGGYNLLGHIHYHGLGSIVTSNMKESFLYYQKGLEIYDGNPEDEALQAEALYNLGSAYYSGLGVERDRRKGLDMLQEAAEKGHATAREWLEQNHDTLSKEGFFADNADFVYEETFDGFNLLDEPISAPVEKPAVDIFKSEKTTKH